MTNHAQNCLYQGVLMLSCDILVPVVINVTAFNVLWGPKTGFPIWH